ncbi:Penicillin-binding protein 1A [Altererythrobacter insulae]|nr:Penicillin-binding protein 1A [Altererythrobacter insulae]
MSNSLTFDLGYIRQRLQGDSAGAWAWFVEGWRGHRLFRWGAALIAVGVVALIAIWLLLARGLPEADSLVTYETPLPTVVRGIDGEIVHSYARDRRIQLQYADFPQQLIDAYLAAEDKTFFTHGGVDLTGTAGAVIDYARKYGSDERAVGGSTITQQVAKNLLLGDEYSVTRKLKEMILATRIESVLSKQEILELYLNEIPLGRRSFGVQAAAQAYFDKDVDQLDLHEMAFLAILPKAPERYGRARHAELAMTRRNFVLSQMQDNGFITDEEMRAAQSMPLGLVTQRSQRSVDAGYFLEEVRRQLLADFGETAEEGPNSVYAGGLWVRTSLDPELQAAARDALRAGLRRYHGSRGWAGSIATIDVSEGNWARQLQSSFLNIRYEDWRIGVITTRSGGSATVGFSNGDEEPLLSPPANLKVGDVLAVRPAGAGYRIAVVPEVSGGFLAQSVQTGRVVAMQGGFDFRLSDFNRATQAQRQPGSTIKPFVYATGLDNGMTPASEVPDQTFCYYQGANLGEKCFRNFGGEGGGVHTMRWGLEQSRNLMTIHIAMDAGMEQVNNTFNRMGIGSYEPYPAFALGAGDTTVMKMVNAYAALANHGKLNEPTVIDYVQDRRGKVIWRADNRRCNRCSMAEWDGQPMPRFGLKGEQAMDARTAFQTVHMLEGVVTRGTATRLRDLNLPMFGKTGTTTGPTNAWFVGGTPEIVAGVYVGHDQPRNLGGWVQGGNTAAPIFKEFVQKTRARWSDQPAVAPNGIRMVRIDRKSGKRVFSGEPSDDARAAVIWEAFKPDTEPPRVTRQDQIADLREELLALIRRGTNGGSSSSDGQPSDFVEEQGGIY